MPARDRVPEYAEGSRLPAAWSATHGIDVRGQSPGRSALQEEEQAAFKRPLGAVVVPVFSGPPSPHTYLDVDVFELRGVLLLDLQDQKPTGASFVSAVSDALGLDTTTAAGGEFTAAATGGGGTSGMDLLAVAVAGARNTVLLKGTPPVSLTARSPQPTPLMHALPWSDGARNRVTGLAFTPAGGSDSLLACTASGGVHVIHTLLTLTNPRGRRNSSSRRGPDQGASDPVLTLVSSGPPVVAVTWWLRAIEASECAIAVTQKGDVFFWDGATGDALRTVRVATCSSLGGAFVMGGYTADNGIASPVDLLLFGEVMAQRLGHTDDDVTTGGDADAAGAAGDTFVVATPAAWTIRLEESDVSFDTALSSSSPDLTAPGRSAAFTAVPVVGRFGCGPPGVWPPPESAILSVHCGGTLLVRHEPSTGLCQLFDVAAGQVAHGEPPLEELTLPLQCCAVCATPRAIFAMHPSPARVRSDAYAGWCVSVVARSLHHGGRGAPRRGHHGNSDDGGGGSPYSPAPAATIIQEILLGPAFEDAFRAGGLLAPPPHLGGDSSLDAPVHRGSSRRRPAPVIDGPFVWSPWALAHVLEGRAPPEAHVVALLGGPSHVLEANFGSAVVNEVPEYVDAGGGDSSSLRGLHHSVLVPPDTRATLLATGLGLPLEWLHTLVARDAAAAGEMARARQLFRAAGVAMPHVVAACLAEGRTDDALEELAGDGNAGSTSSTSSPSQLLRLACVTHMQLSAWAAAAAGCALSSAPPGAAADAAEAARAASGGMYRDVTPTAAAAAAAAVAQALQRANDAFTDDGYDDSFPGVSDDVLAAVSAAATSACTAAAAAAAVASGVQDAAQLGDGGTDRETGGAQDEASKSGMTLRAEAMLRLMLACGRVAEALQSQGVALAEATSEATPPTPWLPPHQASHVQAVVPSLEDALLLRPGTTAHAVATWAASHAGAGTGARAGGGSPAPPRVCPSQAALAMLSQDGLMRAVALAAPPGGGAAAVDVDSQVAALGALALRAPPRARLTRSVPVQRALDAALGQHWGRIRSPWRMAAICATAMDNLPAAATVFSLAGDWERSALCRLAALGTSTATAEDDAPVLLQVLTSSLATAASPDARWRVVLHVMAAWHTRGLPQVKLEAALLEACSGSDATADAVSRLLLASGGEEAGSSSAPSVVEETTSLLPFRLSGRFALRLAALRVDAARRGASASRPLSLPALWDQVRRNLTERAHIPSVARVCWPPASDGVDVSSSAVTAEGGPPVEILAFSCGHACTAVQMEDVLLPRLVTRMQGLGMHLSAHMVSYQYECSRVALACPACVLAVLDNMAAAQLR